MDPKMDLIVATFRKVLHLQLGLFDLTDDQVFQIIEKLVENKVAIGLRFDLRDPDDREFLKRDAHETLDRMFAEVDSVPPIPFPHPSSDRLN